MRATLTIALLALGCVATACRSTEPCITLGTRTGEIVRELLQTRLAARQLREPNPVADRVEVLVGNLHRDQSREADQAAVVLMAYYLGEANNEDVQEDILLRGKRMIPLVKGLKHGRRTACGLAEFASLKLPLSTVQSGIQETLEMLKKGQTNDLGL
jgi:hypothetical protein